MPGRVQGSSKQVSGSAEALQDSQWGRQHTGAPPTGTANTAQSCYSPDGGVRVGQAPLRQRAPCSNLLFLVEEGQGEKG